MAWEPCGAVTGEGPLPFTDPDVAVDFVADEHPDLPFCPEPPCRDLVESIGVHLGSLAEWDADWRTGDEFDVAVASAPTELAGSLRSSFDVFVAAGRCGMFSSAAAVKGQVVGPFSLARFIHLDGRPALTRPSTVAALARLVARRAVWQTEQLRLLGLPVLVVIDEPALGAAVDIVDPHSLAAVLAEVVDAVRRSGGIAGLNLSGQVDPVIVGSVRPDVLVVDVASVRADRMDVICRFWAGGGIVACRVGLRNDAGVMGSADERFGEWLGAALRCPSLAGAARRTLFSLDAAGFAVTSRDAREFARVGRLVRRVAGG